MALFRTSNPALGDKTFRDLANIQYGGLADTSRMTLSGTVNKTGILLLLAMATAFYTWSQFLVSGDASTVSPLMLLGVFGGFILAMVTTFKMEWAPVTAPIYALLEGLFLGGVSAFFNARYPGIAIQAVTLTFGTLFVMLLCYSSGLIKVTEKFRIGIIAATGGICLFYLLSMVLSLFHLNYFSSVFGNSPIGIGFSLVVVAIAALNLVLNFDYIEHGVQVGAPKYMEWYCAFGMILTLVWLYLEILRLLSKMRSRN
jgi:uncharacterized YccA/Bax inhibitor family protein